MARRPVSDDLPHARLVIPLAFAFVACGGESTQELPFDRVGIALYSHPLVAADDGRLGVTFPRDETQYVEVAIPPDRGIYVFLVAGTMTLTVPDAPEVGSKLTVQEMDLEITRDDFLPDRWMLGAKLEMRDSVAECLELADWGTRWGWQSVGELRITTRDGRGHQTLPWLPDDYSGSISQGADGRTFFPPSLSFSRRGASQ